jgi:uncharacterized membrane protein YfcA
MVSFVFSLAIGTVLGFLAGMGVGGGSLLLLWLTQVAEFPQEQARLINLLFFLPAAIVATFFRKRQKSTRPDVIRPGIITGCCTAAVFSLLSRNWDLTLMKKLLGGLLVITGLREIFYRPRKAR